MRKLTDKDIEYINDKPSHYRDYGFVVGRKIAEIYLEDIGGDINKLKNSPYFIDKPLLATSSK